MDGSDDKEYGKSMKESSVWDLSLDLTKENWFVYEDFYGTSEEKYLVKYIQQLHPKLKNKYDDIYLVRSERAIRIYDFHTGQAFEPDFLLFMRKKEDGKFLNMQIFIEPKGEHLREHDEWKEDFLKEIHDNAVVIFETQVNHFKIWGMPFYTNKDEISFDKAMNKEFGVSGWE